MKITVSKYAVERLQQTLHRCVPWMQGIGRNGKPIVCPRCGHEEDDYSSGWPAPHPEQCSECTYKFLKAVEHLSEMNTADLVTFADGAWKPGSWISVKDQPIPKYTDRERVLVTDGIKVRCCFDPEVCNGHIQHSDSFGRCGNEQITHWMPLPSPPETKK